MIKKPSYQIIEAELKKCFEQGQTKSYYTDHMKHEIIQTSMRTIKASERECM